jgi:hypothetical protein
MLGRRESRRESVTMRRITVPNGAAYIMRQERGDSSITISDTQGRLLLRQRYEGPSGSRVRRSIALSWGDSGAEPYQRVRLEPGSEEIPEVKWLLLWCLWRVAFADWASNQVTGIA